MSVVVLAAAPAVVLVGPGVLASIATAVAASLGLRTLEGAEPVDDAQVATEAQEAEAQVEVTTAAGAALGAVVAERCTLTFGDDRVTVTISRDVRGALTVRAHGRDVPRAELQQRADRLLGLILQQVAYREIVRTMKEHGLAVAEEERLPDGTARVRIRRSRGSA